MLPDIVHHFHHLDIGSAVPRPLQRRHGRRHRRISIRTGGCYHTGRKGRVITTAMLHVKHQRHIQNLCLQKTVLFIRAQQHQKILCSRQTRIRAMDVHTFISLIMVVCMISIYCQHWKYTDQVHALTDHISNIIGIHIFIIRCQGQNTSGHRIHNIFTWRLHNNISGKIGRKCTTLTHQFLKFFLFFCCRRLSKEQKIGSLSKTKRIFWNIADPVCHIVSTVPQLSITRNFLSVFYTKGINS